jgi:hypothetical protein
MIISLPSMTYEREELVQSAIKLLQQAAMKGGADTDPSVHRGKAERVVDNVVIPIIIGVRRNDE